MNKFQYMDKLQHMVELSARALIGPERGTITLYCDPEYDVAKITLYGCSRKELIELAGLLGTASKNFYGDQFWLEGELEGITVIAHAPRELVCRKIVIGTKVVPEQVIPTHEKEIVEWECNPLLA